MFKLMRTAAAAALAISSFVGAAHANTYNIDIEVGAGGVSGFIETTGIGTINNANIVDWLLVLDDGDDVFTLFGDGSPNDNSEVSIIGTALTATETELRFDFSAITGQALFQAPTIGSAETFVCFETTGCASSSNSIIVLASNVFGNREVLPQTGVVTIGTTATAVPLPAGAWLLISGVAGLVVVRRTRTRVAA